MSPRRVARAAVPLTPASSSVMIQETLATIAHELRNPLTLIRSETSRARRSSDDPVALAESCAIIDRQVNHIAAFLRDLVSLGDVHERDAPLIAERVDLRELMADAHGALGKFVDMHALRVKRTAPRGRVHVRGDRRRLCDTLVVLLATVAKIGGFDGRIKFTAAVNGDTAEILVETTTGAIAPEFLSTVFEPLVQSRRDGIDNAGVSLAIARRTIQAHGGSLAVRSRLAPPQTSFTVQLPRAT